MGNFDSFNRQKNDYFHYQSEYDNEKTLYDLMITEAYNLHGVCMTYFVTTYNTQYNRIWGEDNDRRWERQFEFMAYTELPKEETNWTKYGIEPFDTVIVWVSKRHFEEASKYDSAGTKRLELSAYIPKIGDIIRLQYSQYYYEVVDVSQEEEMFHQTKHSWELTVRPYKNEHLGFQADEFPFQTSASMPGAIAVTSAADIFDISETINEKKSPIIFSAGPCEAPRNKNKYGWW